jgi:hypothetical protein
MYYVSMGYRFSKRVASSLLLQNRKRKKKALAKLGVMVG